MAGQNIIGATSISPQVIVSQQLGTSEAAVYTTPAVQSVKIAHGVLCNVTGTMPAPALSVGTLAAQANIVAPTLAAPTTATTGGTLAAATYYYVATTTDAFGETAKSAEVSQVTTGTTSTVTLSWASVSGSQGTKIYRGTAAAGENVLVATLTSGTSWTDTGGAGTTATPPTAVTSTAVFWKVSAKNTAGETLGSNEVTATVAANQSAPLSWGAVTGAVSYNVFRGTSAGNENILVTNVTGTSYSDMGNTGTTQSPVTTQTTGTAVPVYLSVLKSGQPMGDNTHRVINAYSLAVNDALSLKDYIAGAMLGPGDFIAAYAQYAGSVNAIITGTVHA